MTNPYLQAIGRDDGDDEDNPYLQALGQPDFESSRGRLRADYESRVRLIEQLKKSLQDPNITPERRDRIKRLIQRHEPESVLGSAPTVGESVKRFVGGAAGAIPGTAMAALDLIAAGGSVLPVVGETFKRGREKLAEGQAALQEVTGAEGIEGILGGFAGGMGASAVSTAGKAGQVLSAPFALFAKPAQAVIRGASRVVPGAAKAVTGNIWQRVVGQALADIPVNLAQAVSIPNATEEEMLQAFATQSAASAAGGVLPPGKPGVTRNKPGRTPPPDPTTGQPTRPVQPTAPDPGAAKLIKKVQAEVARRELLSQARQEAKAAWENANQGKSWKDDLSKTERATLVKERLDALQSKDVQETVRAEEVKQEVVEAQAQAVAPVEAPVEPAVPVKPEPEQPVAIPETPVIKPVDAKTAEERVKAREARTGPPATVPGGANFFGKPKRGLTPTTKVIKFVKANFPDFEQRARARVDELPKTAPAGHKAVEIEFLAREMAGEKPLSEFPNEDLLKYIQMSDISSGLRNSLETEARARGLEFTSRAGPPESVAPKTPQEEKVPVVKEMETIDPGKKLADLTKREIDVLKEKVFKLLETLPETAPEYQAAVRDINLLGRITRGEPTPAVQPLGDVPKVRVEQPEVKIVTKKVAAEVGPKPMDRALFRKLFTTPAKNLTPEQLTLLQQALEERLVGMTQLEGDSYRGKLDEIRQLMTAKVDEISETKAERADPPRTDGVVLNLPAQVAGGAVGMMVGWQTGDTEEERRRNAILFGIAGAIGGGVAAKYLPHESKQRKMVPGQKEIADRVKRTFGEESSKGISIWQRIHNAYQGVFRPEHGIEYAERKLVGPNLPDQYSAAKAVSNFGAHIAQSDQFFLGVPYHIMPDGTRAEIPGAKNLIDIIQIGGGSIDDIGELAVAKTALERYTLGKPIPGISLPAATQFVANASPELHAAVDALRAWYKHGLEQAQIAGLVSKEAVEKMTAEEFYTAIRYIFSGKVGEKPQPIGREKKGIKIGSPQPIKERSQQGLPEPIRNPIETAMEVMPRILRAAEMNMARQKLLSIAMAAPKEIRDQFIRPAPRNKAVDDPIVAARAKAIHQLTKLSPEESVAVAANFSEDINALSPSITVFRKGTLQTWRVSSGIAQSFLALSPHEQTFLQSLLTPGLYNSLAELTNIARKGIVYNPLFIGYQAFRDQFQASMNSQYGFVWGWDSLRAWVEMMRDSDNYKEYIRYGGGDPRYFAAEALSLKEASKALETHGTTIGQTALKQIRSMHPIDAYKTLMTPIYESARFGEFLRARAAGATALESVYAAKRVVGNFQRTGAAIKGLSKISLFLNPAVRAMDESLYSSGLHPYRAPAAKGLKIGPLRTDGSGFAYTRSMLEDMFKTELPEFEGRAAAAVNYAVKGFATITAASLLFHAAYGDDQELNELRKAEGGSRYWWIRSPAGAIIKIPKPILEGQIFGTTAEAALDTFRDNDPEAWRRWADAVMQDASINLLPLAAAVPMSIWANKDPNLGGPITPQSMTGLEAQYQERPETTLPARFVGKALSPLSDQINNEAARRLLSPIGIDYIVRQFGGRIAQETMVGLTQAVEYLKNGRLHPAYELPFIRQQLVHYPKTAVVSIDSFYRTAERVEIVAKTMKHLAERDVTQFMEYVTRHQDEIPLIDLFSKGRAEMSDLWNAIDEIKRSEDFSPDQKREVIEEMTRAMIENARTINTVANSMKR